MIIQIYTMQSVKEAQDVVALGVDHIGITPANAGLPGEVDYDTARAIVNAVGERAVCVALSVESDIVAIVEMVNRVNPDILHLCGLQGSLPPDAVGALREQLPGIPVMQAISVSGPQAIDTALEYQDTVDYIILDTQSKHIAGIGASGVTHNWSISRVIVRQVRIPVILAGGLSPENVGEAIHAVKPWGVDSLTHTNRVLPGGVFTKDLGKVRSFISAAQGGQALFNRR